MSRTDPPLVFRGSRAGGCIREIVAAELHPDWVEPPDSKRAFLAQGHAMQAGAVEHLNEHGAEIFGSESEGEIVCKSKQTGKLKWVIRGHLDGLRSLHEEPTEDPKRLANVEVKALTHYNYGKVSRATRNWHRLYGYYLPQAHTYTGFKNLWDQETGIPVASDVDIEHTEFVFVNRNTGDMLGGVPIEAPQYTYREGLIVPHKRSVFSHVVRKHRQAAVWIRRGEMPDKCDKFGKSICFFCRRFNYREEIVLRVDGDSPKVLRGPVTDFLEAREDYSHALARLESASKKLGDQAHQRRCDGFQIHYGQGKGFDPDLIRYDDWREFDGRPETDLWD